jgi:hypothetical protein
MTKFRSLSSTRFRASQDISENRDKAKRATGFTPTQEIERILCKVQFNIHDAILAEADMCLCVQNHFET